MPLRVGRVLLRQLPLPAGDQAIDLGPRLRERDAGLEPAHEVEVMIAPVARLSGIEGEGDPGFDPLVADGEARRHHPDHRTVAAVHLHPLPDDLRVGPERLPPQRVGEHHHGLRVRQVFRGRVVTAERGVHPEGPEQPGRGERGVGPHRLALAGDVDSTGHVGAQAVEAPVPVAVLRELDGIDPEAVEAHGRELAVDDHQPVRIAVGQRLEEHGVGHAEDRGVGPDPERQGHGGQQGEAGAAEQQAASVTEVLDQGFHRGIPLLRISSLR